MSTVYIISEHGRLNRTNETLEFTSGTGDTRRIFPHKLDSLIVSGNLTITGAAMRLLMKHQINTLFLGYNGRFNGKLVFSGTKNVFLRKKQYALSDNAQSALGIAKAIVGAKIKNELSFVQRIKRKEGDKNEFNTVVQSLKTMLEKSECAASLDELRGYEGTAARNYFSVFKKNLDPEWADFPFRSKNPPRSNVNAVLSFLYTLLMYRVESAIEYVGLDPMAGFLHASEYGKNALVFDLMEEWRTPVADTLCCALFNLGTLKQCDFEAHSEEEMEDVVFSDDAADGAGGAAAKAVFLTKDGLKKVIPAFEKKIDTLLAYPQLDKRLSFNKIIIEQAEHLKRVVLGEELVYKGYYYK